MVPVTAPDERKAHAAEVSARFLALMAHVPDLGFPEVDRLLGFDTVGHARQIAHEGKVPGVPKARKLAALFGTSDAWLLCGTGTAPGERRVRRAVAAARERLESGHTARVTTSAASRKTARASSKAPPRRASARP